MPEQVPFINREQELEQIETLIKEWNTRRVLCINAPGGIGKTRLLQEVRERYSNSVSSPGLLVPAIIDFDDRALHIVENMGRKIARLLGEDVFKPYLQGLIDWRKMEMAGVSQYRLQDEATQVNQAFVDCFNTVTGAKRVVLLLDTTDALTSTGIWNYIINLATQSRNILFIIAGRNADRVYEELLPEIVADIQLIQLRPLELEASKSYLQQKQDLLHINLDPDIEQKLLLLAQGRAILIDLAVEWLARAIPLPWLEKMDSAELSTELEKMSNAERQEWQEEFEYQLICHIAKIRNQVDRLTLLMSRVYPLNEEMIKELLEISSQEAHELIKEARAYVFVKSLPDGRITLHDEMRRMVDTDRLWDKVDPEGNRRRHDSKRAIAYWGEITSESRKQIQQFRTLEEEAQDIERKTAAFVRRETLERTLWVIEEQRLYHSLYISLKQGIELFSELFDEATRAYRFSLRKMLITKVQLHREHFTLEQLYEVDIRRAKYLLDCAKYEKAIDVLENLLDETELFPQHQIEIYLQLGNNDIRLGKFREGIANFDKAVQISQQHELKKDLMLAKNALGWAHRLIGEWDDAILQYREALKLSLELNDQWRQASLLNNLGFAYAVHRTEVQFQQVSLQLCQQAFDLWSGIGFERGIGTSYSTLGSVYYKLGHFDKAIIHFQEALEIFEPTQDREWLSTVYSWRGATYLALQELQKAEKDLLRSLSFEVHRDEAMTLNRLARVYLKQGKIVEAHNSFEKSYNLSRDRSDGLYELVSLIYLVKIAVIKREITKLESFETKFKGYLERWPEWKKADPLTLGRLQVQLGNLALEANKLDHASDLYQEGLKLVHRSGSYADVTLVSLLEEMEDVFRESGSSNTIVQLGQDLERFWLAEEFDTKHPEALLFFARWKAWQEDIKKT